LLRKIFQNHHTGDWFFLIFFAKIYAFRYKLMTVESNPSNQEEYSMKPRSTRFAFLLLLVVIALLLSGIYGCANQNNPLEPNQQSEKTRALELSTANPNPGSNSGETQQPTDTTEAIQPSATTQKGGANTDKQTAETETALPLEPADTQTAQALTLPLPTSTTSLLVLPTNTLVPLMVKSATPSLTPTSTPTFLPGLSSIKTATAAFFISKSATPTITTTPTVTKTSTPTKTKTVNPNATKTPTPTATTANTFGISGVLLFNGQPVSSNKIYKTVTNCTSGLSADILRAKLTVTQSFDVQYKFVLNSNGSQSTYGPYMLEFASPTTLTTDDRGNTNLTCGEYDLQVYKTFPFGDQLLDEYVLFVSMVAPTKTPVPTATKTPMVMSTTKPIVLGTSKPIILLPTKTP
jgi:hypothetical protein